MTRRRWRSTTGLALLAAGAPLGVLALQPAPALAPTAAASSVTVLVSGRPGGQTAVLAAVRRLGGAVVAPRAVLDGAEVRLPTSALPALSADPVVEQVAANASLQLASAGWTPDGDEGSLNQIDESVRAKDVWGKTAADGTKVTGSGTGIALIDSGVARVAGLDAPGQGHRRPRPDPRVGRPRPRAPRHVRPRHPHGGHHRRAGHRHARTTRREPRVFAGVAPGATHGQRQGRGRRRRHRRLAGHRRRRLGRRHRKDPGLNIRVLNLSFGTDSHPGPARRPAGPRSRERLARWHRRGRLGRQRRAARPPALTSPATDPYVIAVGATDHHGTAATTDDTVASFSNNGSATRGVDVLAPGTSVDSLRDPGSSVDTAYSSTGRINAAAAAGGLDPARLFRGSGTSQAAAVVSGAAALLVDQRPTLTPDQVKALLMLTAHPVAGAPRSRQGAGTIDVRNASQTLTPVYAQLLPRSTGTGTLEGARGSYHLTDPVAGTQLTGEQDLFGTAWNAGTWAAASSAGTSWSGGLWNGQRWSGDAWSGNRWTEGGWDRNSWSRRTWSSGGWSDATWTSAGWSRRTWSDAGWSSAGWSNSGWTASSWR